MRKLLCNALALGRAPSTEASAEGMEERSGDAGGSGALAVCCCASVLWMLVNLRCSRSTCARHMRVVR